MATPIRQSSFAAGEIAPEFQGQSESPLYQAGCAKLSNWLVTEQGSLVRRPGVKWIAAVPTGHVSTAFYGPFKATDTDKRIVVEVLNGPSARLRFWYTDGTPVYDALSAQYEISLTALVAGGAVFNAATTWASSGDVTYLVNPACRPMKLAKGANDYSWTLTVADFSVDAFTSTGFTWESGEVAAGSETWDWVLTEWTANGTGGYSETLASVANPSAPCQVDVATPATVIFKATTGGLNKRYSLYRGNRDSKVYGWVADFSGVGVSVAGEAGVYRFRIKDPGLAPDFGLPPPEPSATLGDSPFSTPGNYPAVATFFEDRLILAGTANRPFTIWGSRPGNYENFRSSWIGRDDDSFEFTLQARQYEKIFGIRAGTTLEAYTTHGMWQLSGNGGPLTASNVSAKRNQAPAWNSAVYPVEYGNFVACARASGPIDAVQFSNESQSVNSQLLDRTVPDYRPVGRMARVQSQVDCLVAFRQQTSVSNTYEVMWGSKAAEGAMGWSRTTDLYVNAMLPIPDKGYMFVTLKHGNNDYYVGLIDFSKLLLRTELCLDGYVTFNSGGSTSKTITGLTHLKGKTVVAVLVDPTPAASFSFGVKSYGTVNSSGEVTLTGLVPTLTYAVGIVYTSELELLPVAANAKYPEKRPTKVELEVKTAVLKTTAGTTIYGLRVGQIGATTRVASDYAYGSGTVAEAKRGTVIDNVEVRFNATYNKDGVVSVQVDHPYQCSLVSVTRHIDFGGIS